MTAAQRFATERLKLSVTKGPELFLTPSYIAPHRKFQPAVFVRHLLFISRIILDYCKRAAISALTPSICIYLTAD